MAAFSGGIFGPVVTSLQVKFEHRPISAKFRFYTSLNTIVSENNSISTATPTQGNSKKRHELLYFISFVSEIRLPAYLSLLAINLSFQ